MTTKAAIKFIASLVSIIIMTLLLTANDSFARRKEREYSASRQTHREKVIVRKDVRYKPNRAERNKFRYNRSRHYRPYRSAYYPWKPGVINRLPYGYRTVWLGDTSYFFFRGTFYERGPSGYVVVTSPPETVIVRETSTITHTMEPASGNVLATVSTLNVRSGPGLEYALVRQVREGSILKLLGKTDGWLYVELTDGQSGWVKSVFTEHVEPGSG